jgi:GNAT superfamily N-acetyltransferase
MMIPLDLDGYTALPPGKLASVVTYLEMTEPPPASTPDARHFTLQPIDRSDLNGYRDLFRRIGSRWLWGSRLRLSDAELAAILSNPSVDVLQLIHDDRPAGLLELDRTRPPEVEISFFGIVEELIGRGAGRYLMAQALQLAWTGGTRRVWLHTCSLDHPRALEFYMRAGFRPYARALEVWDDPRLTGVLPREAAPHVPLL